MDLSIIIVNWNVKPLLERCLESIFKEKADLEYELIIIDNASKDKSCEFLSQLKSQITNLKTIFNNENSGFARAVNQGLKIARGEFILLLNPDTEIFEKTLEKTVNFLRQYSHCGVLGCKILNLDGSAQYSVRSFPNLIVQVLILLKLHNFLPRLKPIEDYFLWDFDYSKTQLVDQVSGAFLATRNEIVKRIGGFDEKFFLWFEEVDFCRRVKQAGWEIMYTPNICIRHYGAQSFFQLLPFNRQRQFNQSLLHYFKKHHSKNEYLILYLLQPISLLLALLIQIFKLSKNRKYGEG